MQPCRFILNLHHPLTDAVGHIAEPVKTHLVYLTGSQEKEFKDFWKGFHVEIVCIFA